VQNIFSGKLTTSRGGAIALGLAAALLAGILLLVYLDRYRDSVSAENAPISVITAKSLIPKGTSGTIIATKSQYAIKTYQRDEVKLGALTDPAYINGRVAVADILPGQQITVNDFTPATTVAAKTQLLGAQRALTIPVDALHGTTNHISAGDRVDLYIVLNTARGQTIKLFRENVYILGIPGGPGPSGGNAGFVLRIPSSDVVEYLVGIDQAKFEFVIRPETRAKKTPAEVGTYQNLLRATGQ
jgi:Flp pilus assembly protein CpaB